MTQQIRKLLLFDSNKQEINICLNQLLITLLSFVLAAVPEILKWQSNVYFL